MLRKAHLLESQLDTGEFRVKVADFNEIDAFVEGLKPDPNFLYLHVIAMGAGEYYGCNRNGDYFPERSLIMYHHTFEQNAKVFREHKNKSDSPSYGFVAKSWYNPGMHRVELVLAVDRAKATDIVEKMERGEHPEVSMGCRVPHDVCSICGNKAAKKNEYCYHIRNENKKVYSDGKQVFMLNLQPTFFDISFVFRRADKIALTLRKIAGSYDEIGTIEHVEDYVEKEATEKDVPADAVVRLLNQGMLNALPKVERAEPDLPTALLDKMALKYSIGEIINAFLANMIPMKPREFTRVVIVHHGMPLSTFDHIHRQLALPAMQGDMPDEFSADAAEMLVPYLGRRSSFSPYLVPRIIKTAEVYSPEDDGISAYEQQYASVPVQYDPSEYHSRLNRRLRLPNTPMETAMAMAGIYAAYRGVQGLGRAAKYVNTHKWPIALGAAGILGANALLDVGGEKTAGNIESFMKYKVALPFVASHFAAAHYRRKYQEGQSLNPLQKFVAEHPDYLSLIAPVALHGAHMLTKGKVPPIKTATDKTADMADAVSMVLLPGVFMRGKYSQGVNLADQALDVVLQRALLHKALGADDKK